VQRWASAIRECDSFIFIAAEYNYSIAGVLKNALDYNILQ
jgi:NAD(P)H-dependent FMN reductase